MLSTEILPSAGPQMFAQLARRQFRFLRESKYIDPYIDGAASGRDLSHSDNQDEKSRNYGRFLV
jgi:hypothetical protein